jgi:hypothetical protein
MKISSILLWSFFVLLSANAHATVSTNLPIASAESAQLRAATYDGKWSGTIKCLYDPGLWPEDECDVGFTFEINGSSLSVQEVVRSKNGKETTSAINPGKFKFVQLATNAIAISLDKGNDEDGTWVETWSFAMTLTDSDHMTVHWTRIVNNIDMPKNQKGSKFSSVGMGELVRMPMADPSSGTH